MSVTPVVVNFRRMIIDEDLDGTVVDGVRNRDLLHAVVALYDQSLPDVTTEIIYSHVCRAASKSLLFIRDKEGTLQEIIEKDKTQKTKKEGKETSLSEEIHTDNATSEITDSEVNKGDDKEEEEEEDEDNEDNEDNDESSAEESGLFDDIYSDTESSEESSESSDSEEEDLSAGSKEFIEAVKYRRELRSAGKFTDDCIGIESRLAGAASFERLVGKDELGVMQLSLIAVRRRYRRRGLGRRLINMIKDPSVVGKCSCVIAYVDHGALKFFRKHGFTDDVIISRKFKHLSEHWENSTFMCYLPPYSDLDTHRSCTAAQDVAVLCQLDKDVEDWRQMHLVAHEKQVILMERMRHELLEMAVKIRTQDGTIKQLTARVNELSQEKELLAKEFDDYRKNSHAAFESTVASVAERFLDLSMPENDNAEDGVKSKLHQAEIEDAVNT